MDLAVACHHAGRMVRGPLSVTIFLSAGPGTTAEAAACRDRLPRVLGPLETTEDSISRVPTSRDHPERLWYEVSPIFYVTNWMTLQLSLPVVPGKIRIDSRLSY